MNLKEFDEFRMLDAVKFHQELNPALFDSDGRMHAKVRRQLLVIAQDFMDHLGVPDIDVKDITVSGSNAAYTYTKHSDIDLHILVDMAKLRDDEVYRELFTAKKVVYNDSHDIKIRGYDVELYVQDVGQPVKSLGEYSVLNDSWVKYPSKRRANFDEHGTKEKFIKLVQLSELALHSDKLEKVEGVLDTIKKYRQAGLEEQGEFGPENLAYKALRSRGIVDQLYKHRDELHSKKLSIEGAGQLADEDWHPNATPPGPETRPTMPKGTVRVDVSDVYDWYKLGQHISNLHGLGHHDFGKGPPSTIMSFGSEDEEHRYIKDLEKTGLITTDIDPVDPNQPKGMKRQKTDPTYNVDETVVGMLKVPEFKPGSKILHNFLPRGGVVVKLDGNSLIVKGLHDNKLYKINPSSAKLAQSTEKPCFVRPCMAEDQEQTVDFGDPVKYRGIVMTMYEGDDGMKLEATSSSGERLGFVEFSYDTDGTLRPEELEVYEKHRGRGIAKAMYDFMKGQGYKVARSSEQTPAGRGFWDKHRPGQRIWEETSSYKEVEFVCANPAFPGATDPKLQRKLYVELKKIPGVIPFLQDQGDYSEGQMSLTAIYKNPAIKNKILRLAKSLGVTVDLIQPVSDNYVDRAIRGEHEGQINEASGYIPSNAERNDWRFKTALTVDVKPDSIKKNAKKLGLGAIQRSGVPPTARPDGKLVR